MYEETNTETENTIYYLSKDDSGNIPVQKKLFRWQYVLT